MAKVAKESAKEEVQRFEREYLIWHSDASKAALQHKSIVQCVGNSLYGLKVLMFDYEDGVAVEYLCYCGGDNKARNVARLVYRGA